MYNFLFFYTNVTCIASGFHGAHAARPGLPQGCLPGLQVPDFVPAQADTGDESHQPGSQGQGNQAQNVSRFFNYYFIYVAMHIFFYIYI